MTLAAVSPTTSWPFLSAHTRVLVCIQQDPTIRLWELAKKLGATERYAFNLICELRVAGYLESHREGRRVRYTLRLDQPLRHPTERHRTLKELTEFASGEACPS